MSVEVLLLGIEFLFLLSASPPRPLMSPFPVLSHNALNKCAHMGLLWTSWVGWCEVIFPSSVLHEKTSGLEGRAKESVKVVLRETIA